MTDPVYLFLAGAIAMGFAVAALFFLRFWRRTRDVLFLAFAAAFALLAANHALIALSGAPREEQSPYFLLLALGQALLALTNVPVEERSWIYLLRLAAFTLIIIGIVHKNRAD